MAGEQACPYSFCDDGGCHEEPAPTRCPASAPADDPHEGVNPQCSLEREHACAHWNADTSTAWASWTAWERPPCRERPLPATGEPSWTPRDRRA